MSIVKNNNNITKAFYGHTPIYTFGNINNTTGDCTLESITITENGEYYPNEGIDGYNEVIVNVHPKNDEAYEQGKADQKALMTTGVFNSVGTYTREDGWNEVKVNVFWFSPFMEKTILYKFQGEWDGCEAKGYEWAVKMSEYNDTHPDLTSNGMMYEIDYYGSVYFYDWKILNIEGKGISIWGKKSLVTPWVYNANNSPSTRKVLPDYFLGGFDCTEVEYINRVFEGAETLKAFLSLKNLGKSFTSVNTLDLSVLTNLNEKYYDGDCFIILANSVYNFTKEGMNVNGISYSNVKLPASAKEEQISAWTSVGWVVTM